jgi:hypothetical protein
MIMPKMVAPPTAAPLMRKAPRLVLVRMAMSAARTTGPPSRIPRNTDRRDHSIWPSDRSKMRSAEAPSVGVLML